MTHICVCPQGRPGMNGLKGEKGESTGLPVSMSGLYPKTFFFF